MVKITDLIQNQLKYIDLYRKTIKTHGKPIKINESNESPKKMNEDHAKDIGNQCKAMRIL